MLPLLQTLIHLSPLLMSSENNGLDYCEMTPLEDEAKNLL